MKNRTLWSFVTLIGAIVFLAELAIGAADSTKVKKIDADNSGINIRDRKAGAVTAADQGMSKADTEITRRIREAIMAKENLSVYAQNVKVITHQGRVTLKGPVESAAEIDMLSKIATQIAGANFVKNELQVAADNIP